MATPLPMNPNEPKRGFWSKVLGRKDKAETTPQPAKATPAPKPKRGAPKKEKPEPSTPEPAEKPAAKPEKPAPKATPEPKPEPAPKATPAPKAGKSAKPSAKPAPAESEGNAEEAEEAKFKTAKAKASEDPEVQELRQKSDAALGDEEGRKAMRAYNKALYRKMRSIDPSIKERIDAHEAAILRRLGE